MFKNKFFAPPDQEDGEPRRKGRVYAAIEVPELDDGFQPYKTEPIYLECVDTSWFHSFKESEKGQHWSKLLQAAPLSVLELTSYNLPPFPEDSKPGDIAWFEFGYEPATILESDARIYTNLLSDGATVRISFHEPRPIGWEKEGRIGEIAQALAIYNSSSSDLKERLARISTAGGVAFYDVGQGACQAAIDDEMLIP
ncbi:hypothetical protein EEA47_12910 [Vibrio alginolyticus]|uniref:hypothetical protein n=1 Tax=Vibrio alginolyticus TaxID=663 RepID=UPI00227CA9EB|nr:hypothetical protein [Vibrio alginolyticus]WAG27185.1 hypothetical protein EEA47_12910 [Vibrio alginolyticus]